MPRHVCLVLLVEPLLYADMPWHVPTGVNMGYKMASVLEDVKLAGTECHFGGDGDFLVG